MHDTGKGLMLIVSSSCYKCGKPIKVAAVNNDRNMSSWIGPEEFTEEELDFARSKGVFIKSNFSKTMGTSYLSNTCPHCSAFVGQHYLFTEYIAAFGSNDEVEREEYVI